MKTLNKTIVFNLDLEKSKIIKKLNTHDSALLPSVLGQGVGEKELTSTAPFSLSTKEKKNLNFNINKLTKYTKNLNLKSKLSNKNEIILTTKKEYVAVQPSPTSSGNNTHATHALFPALTGHGSAASSSALNSPLVQERGNGVKLQSTPYTRTGGSGSAMLTNYLKTFSKFNLDIARSQIINYKFNNVPMQPSPSPLPYPTITPEQAGGGGKEGVYVSPMLGVGSEAIVPTIALATPGRGIVANNTQASLALQSPLPQSRTGSGGSGALAQVREENKFLKNINTILENSFLTMSSLISKPIYNITPNKVVIHLFFFLIKNNKNKQIFTKKLELLCANLSKILKKPVVLDLVRLHYPFYDSNILANLLGRICDINFKPYIYILDNIFNKANIKNPTVMHGSSMPLTGSEVGIPSFLTGLKIRLAGRLLKQNIIPRHTVKTTQHGSLTRSSADIVSKARFTAKNKRGTFSITISIGHRFF